MAPVAGTAEKDAGCEASSLASLGKICKIGPIANCNSQKSRFQKELKS